MDIRYNLKAESSRRTEPFTPDNILPFGQLRTDHMFLMDFDGTKWINPRIVPYENLPIAPGAVALHYGQEIFEGAKAFKHEDGEIYTFRIDKNAEMINKSAEIMCMPTLPVNEQIQAIHSLIDVDRDWFPQQEEASLYIRPFMIGTEDSLGVKPSLTYTFCVFLSPSGPYYPEGFTKPIKLLITNRYHRAVSGGSGTAKAAGNYGSSLRAGRFAKGFGASQVLYLDSTNRFVEEAGSMNHFHVTSNNQLVIPEFNDTILRSITSESVIDLSDTLSIDIKQQRISIDDFIESIRANEIIEAGGLGTAAVVTAVGTYILEDGTELTVGDGNIGKVTREVYERLTGIQKGIIPVPPGWMKKVERIVN